MKTTIKRKRPNVLVSMGGMDNAWVKLVELARVLEWALVDLRYREGILPAGLIPDGAIVQLRPGDPLIRKLLKLGCPVVRLGSIPHPKDKLVPSVMHDIEAAGRMAADHFAERGFRHVGYIGAKPWGDMKALYDGLKARAIERGLECHLFRREHIVFKSSTEKYDVRRHLFAKWLETVPKPLGLLGFVDGHAATLCNMCEDSGVSVPEEVAVLGLENILPACEGTRPTLSSIAMNEDKKIETAVLLLRELMTGARPAETTVMIPPLHIVVRESTDTLAVPDKAMARALGYIWEHFDLDIGVDNVAGEAGMSRRQLARRFRLAVGRTVNEELRRKRLEAVCRLLRETDSGVVDIAARVGFHSSDYMHRAFRAAFNTTPRRYRIGSGK